MKKYSLYIKKFQLHTSDKELKDLLIAWILISITFAIVRSTSIEQTNILGVISKQFLITIIISAITVGLGFLLHELAHKVVAQHYKCWAEFRADMTMLMMALLMSFLGFVFIAPGAVMIFGHINKKQNGIISLAGPLINIIIAVLFLPLLFINITNPIWKEIINSGFLINAWLGLFNMIPLWNFDGAKIWRWSKTAYFTTTIVSATLIFIFFMK
jgi:Zn-dependent protease